jgi:hypothetical protein
LTFANFPDKCAHSLNSHFFFDILALDPYVAAIVGSERIGVGVLANQINLSDLMATANINNLK